MAKTIQEINQKIKEGKVVVVTAGEMKEIVAQKGIKEAARTVDVVTTATFGPMCSSGAFLNLGHSRPKIKVGGGRAYLNNVPVYTGLAAVDIYLGASAIPDDDPRNQIYPGEFKYGGGHVIEDLVAGKSVNLKVSTYGTDCYPRKELEAKISLKTINDAVLFNPRNCYQNYNVAVNVSRKMIYTYMGPLKPSLGNANYCSAGDLSPLLNDPYYRTIGIGTKIFLAGTEGFICWPGTQHNPKVKRFKNGIPQSPAGTLALIGDLKHMSPQWLRGVSMLGYGTSLAVGIGIPIPVLDEETARFTAVRNEDIYAPIVDYSKSYPQAKTEVIGYVSYAELRNGIIKIGSKKVRSAGISSLVKAREIANVLKDWIHKKKFYLTQPVAPLSGAESGFKLKDLKGK